MTYGPSYHDAFVHRRCRGPARAEPNGFSSTAESDTLLTHIPSPPHLLSTEPISVSLYGVSLSPRRSFRPLFVNSTRSDVHGPTNGLVSMVQPGGGSAPQPEDARVNNSASIDLRTKKSSTDTDVGTTRRTHHNLAGLPCLLPSRPDWLAVAVAEARSSSTHSLPLRTPGDLRPVCVVSKRPAFGFTHGLAAAGVDLLCFCVFPPALGRGLSWNDSAISGNVGCWF